MCTCSVEGSVLVAVGVLGAQDIGTQSRLMIVRVRFTVFIKLVLLLEVVVVGVLVLAVQSRPVEPSNISVLSAVEVLHTPQSVCVNDDAERNMKPMLVTLDTSHLDMSPLNDDA